MVRSWLKFLLKERQLVNIVEKLFSVRSIYHIFRTAAPASANSAFFPTTNLAAAPVLVFAGADPVADPVVDPVAVGIASEEVCPADALSVVVLGGAVMPISPLSRLAPDTIETVL